MESLIPILLCCLANIIYLLIYTWTLPRQEKFAQRMALGFLVLAGYTTLMVFTESASGRELIWIALAFLTIRLCYHVQPVLSCFWAMTALGVSGCARSMFRLLQVAVSLSAPVSWILQTGVYVLWGYLGWRLMRLRHGDLKRRSDQRLFLAMVVLLLVLFFLVNSIVGSQSQSLPELLTIFILSLLSLSLLYIFDRDMHLRDSYEQIKDLLEKDHIRFNTSREYTELLNVRIHDIKHQIHQLGQQEHVNPVYLRELENAIRNYDTALETGNEAMDIILTEKLRLCARKNIETTIIADGKALRFVSAPDLYSLFGNVLDNAIEAAEQLEDPDMRQISLVAREEAGIVHIRATNYFSHEPVTVDGEFRTTKKDVHAHGFGIKSIQYIARKYGGAVSTETGDHVFTINIILPLDPHRA